MVVKQQKYFNFFHEFVFLLVLNMFTIYSFTSVSDQRIHQAKGRSWKTNCHQTKDRSWRTNCPLVLAACHKLCQGNRVRSLHELSKSARVDERQGQTKVFPNFLCIWTDKEQMLFINNFFCYIVKLVIINFYNISSVWQSLGWSSTNIK